MFLYAFIAILASIGLIQLGALSVWVSILSLTLKIVFALIIGGILYIAVWFVWRHLKSNGIKRLEK